MHTQPMNGSFDSTWFRDRLKAVKGTQQQLADAVGRDRTTINKILTGKSSFDPWFASGFARVLKVSPTEILRRAGLPVDSVEAQEVREPAVLEGFEPRMEPLDGDSDEHLYALAQAMMSLSDAVALGPKLPAGGLARLVRTEADALMAEGATNAERVLLLEHATNLLKAYLYIRDGGR